MDIDDREGLLKERLLELGSFAVAFSGGVDSSVLVKAARLCEVVDFCAVMGNSEVVFAHEARRGREFCRKLRVKLFEIDYDFFGNVSAVKNGVNRCYHCKKELFLKVKEFVRENGYTYLVDGTNLSDLSEDRPGIDAAEEIGVVSPLRECGFEKKDVRELAHTYGIDFWDEPSSACIATRIPTGTPVTLEKVRTVEQGEVFLQKCGFRGPRLRHHGDIARIELRKGDFEKLTDKQLTQKVVQGIRDLGFTYVTVDIEGYRSGST